MAATPIGRLSDESRILPRIFRMKFEEGRHSTLPPLKETQNGWMATFFVGHGVYYVYIIMFYKLCVYTTNIFTHRKLPLFDVKSSFLWVKCSKIGLVRFQVYIYIIFIIDVLICVYIYRERIIYIYIWNYICTYIHILSFLAIRAVSHHDIFEIMFC